MSYYKNLIPGQWQIGDIVMGRGTNIKIETVNVNPYDVNAQDYQVAKNDEMRFGFDSFKPTTIEITLDVLHNRLLPGYEDTIPNFWHSQPTVQDLAKEWRFDEGRNIWGQMKPLYVCPKLDEIPKIVFGRPGQFAYKFDDEYNRGEVMNVLAEFRRADTLSYGINEHSVFMKSGELVKSINANINSSNAPSWMRILLVGPMIHPTITFTNMYNTSTPVVMELDHDLVANEVVELSSYPWSRRVVNNGTPALNLAAKLIGATPYLDKFRFDFNANVSATLAATGMNADSGALVLWRDVYQVL